MDRGHFALLWIEAILPIARLLWIEAILPLWIEAVLDRGHFAARVVRTKAILHLTNAAILTCAPPAAAGKVNGVVTMLHR